MPQALKLSLLTQYVDWTTSRRKKVCKSLLRLKAFSILKPAVCCVSFVVPANTILTKDSLLWLHPVYNKRIMTSVPNMAAAASEANVSRYPSEESVKEALDMLKPPGILSKVSFSTNMSSNGICLWELVKWKRTNVLQYSILKIQLRVMSSCDVARLRIIFLQAYNQFQLKRYQVSYFCCLLVYLWTVERLNFPASWTVGVFPCVHVMYDLW